MKVLIFAKEQDPFEYVRSLAAAFPGVQFLAVKDEAEGGAFLGEADLLVCLRCSNDFIARAKTLKWVHCLISGTNYIEALPAFQARKEILLTSTRGIHGPQVSELCILFLIALNRRFPQLVRNQDQRVWERWPTRLLWNKRIAILGIGVIGEAIARRCKAFEMTVMGIDVVQRALDCIDEFYDLDQLHDVAAQADYFVSMVPATGENERMLDAAFFARMKPTACFVSLGRGEVVDEEALIEALRGRKIAGAALDTFWQEPLPADSPFWGLDNCIVTPHVAGVSDIYVQQAAKILQENLRRYLDGKPDTLLNLISRG